MRAKGKFGLVASCSSSLYLQKNQKFPVTMDVCCILKTCVQMVSGCDAFVQSFAYTAHEQSSFFSFVRLGSSKQYIFPMLA
jgi:hypothetical protein